MKNQHKYIPAVYMTLGTCGVATLISGLIVAGIVAFKSFTGELYNPLFRLPVWLVSVITDKPSSLPISIADLKGLPDVYDPWEVTEVIFGGLYLLAMTTATFVVIAYVFIYISNVIADFGVKYRLGAEGAAAYHKERRKRANILREEAETISDLEKAQHEHYVQWKKAFKSELSYDEWKAKFSGVSNYKVN